jgi:chromosome partitioning protein
VGKTNTAFHLAAMLATVQPKKRTVLVDGDAMNGSVKWKQRGAKSLPFDVVDMMQQAKVFSKTQYDYVVYDTEGNPEPEDVKHYAEGCDLLIIPAVPESAASDGLFLTLDLLEKYSITNFRVLLNRVKHNRRREAQELRSALEAKQVPVFKTEIPEYAAFDKANAQGVAVCDVNDERAGTAWDAFLAVGNELEEAASHA